MFLTLIKPPENSCFLLYAVRQNSIFFIRILSIFVIELSFEATPVCEFVIKTFFDTQIDHQF